MRLKRIVEAAVLAAVVVVASAVPAVAYTNGSRYATIRCTTSCGQQDYSNWCGVAATHAVLHKLGVNVAQATLASRYGVGRVDGSAVAIRDIPGVLGVYVKSFTYVAVPRTSISSVSSMMSVAQYSVDNGHLAIPCVNPYPWNGSPGLPTYSGTKQGGHYLVVRGYNYTTSVQNIYYWDPHYNASHYGNHLATASAFWKCMYYKTWGSQGVVY